MVFSRYSQARTIITVALAVYKPSFKILYIIALSASTSFNSTSLKWGLGIRAVFL